MRTIAVTGGKGGTGKSSFAVLLSLKMSLEGKKVLLVDCDVECPNDFILLGVKELTDPIKETRTFYPKIDPDKCKKCGFCVRSCNSSALLQPLNEVPVLNKNLCSSCGVCWNVCPYGAISKEEEMNGEIFLNNISKNFSLVTGRSIVGIRETSPVVEQTRKYIDTISSDFDLVIIDTAAGTHCTVMSALDGVDRAYSVTEPTPLGAHDLSIILRVLRILKIPSEIILNRSDIGNKDLITQISDKYSTDISLEIPFDRKFAEIYSRGSLIENVELLKMLDGFSLNL